MATMDIPTKYDQSLKKQRSLLRGKSQMVPKIQTLEESVKKKATKVGGIDMSHISDTRIMKKLITEKLTEKIQTLYEKNLMDELEPHTC